MVDANREVRAVRERRSRPKWRLTPRTGLAISLSVLTVGLTACSSKGTGAASTSTTAASGSTGSTGSSGSTGATGTTGSGPSGRTPGVTANSVTVGQVDDLSSPIPGLFKGAEDGAKAYFAYVNSQGGVNGRKLVLDAQDSLFQTGQVATATGAQIRTDFALVGGFSLLDSAEKQLIDLGRVPDVGFSLDPGLASDPYLYSPIPNPVNYYPLGIFKYLKKTYPQAVKKVGIIWENATASTTTAEHAFEAAMKAAGFQIVYDRGAGPFDTNFLSDIISMQHKGVKMFYSTELPDNYAAKLLKEMQQQNFKPIHIEGAAYSNNLLSLAGSSANNLYIAQGYALYLGEDANTVPAVKLFDTWMHKVDSKPNFEIEAVYGWASAELFTQALRAAGKNPTRAKLIAALNQVTLFNAGGLIPPSNPAQAIPSGCFLMAQIQSGKVKRVAPTPSTGFYCGSSGYLAAPGYHPIVRPTS